MEVRKFYYPSGKLQYTETYVNGIRDGECKEYYENGKLKAYGSCYGETLIGYWKYFYDNEDLHYHGRYKDNMEHCIWHVYDKDGIIKVYFHKGEGIEFRYWSEYRAIQAEINSNS